MKTTGVFYIILAIGMLFFILGNTGCDINPGMSLPDYEDKTWVMMEPTQCLTNPWEQDWLKVNNESYENYPKNTYGGTELTLVEKQIIKDYYKKYYDVDVYEIKTIQTYHEVCAACSCPEGYTLHLLVDDNDIRSMENLGYRLSSEIP